MDLLKLNQFPNVSASSLATLVTDELQGRSVHALIFELGGTTFDKSHVDNVRVGIGGKDLVDNISGAQLQDINDYLGLTDTTDYLAYWFGDPTARTVRGQHLGDLDLSLYRDPLQIEVELGAATAPTLQCYALVGAPKLSMDIGFNEAEALQVRALIRTVIQPAAAVSRKSYGIGLGSEAGARLRQIHFFHSALTAVEMKKAGFVKHDNISIALNDFIQEEFARVATGASHYVLDRIVDGNQGEAETTLQADGRPWNFQVNLTTSGSDTITVFSDVHTAVPLI